MAEIKKHIESQMKLLAADRIKQLLERVQPDGLQTRAAVPRDWDDWKTHEEIWLDISELCNWCRLYFGESMRPPMIKPSLEEGIKKGEMLLKEAKGELLLSEKLLKEKLLKEANPLMKVEGLVTLDESVDDDFKERVRNDDDEWMTWSQLNTEKPLANNQRLQALGLIDDMLDKSRDAADYDYLVQEGNVVKFRPAQSRAEPEEPKEPKGTAMPWRDLNVEQAEVARTMVTKALKINPTIRDLAMHNYTVEDGKVTGLEFNPAGNIESML